MNSIKHNVRRLQQLVLTVALAVLINALLFAGLPWLNRVVDRDRERKTVPLQILTPRKPPKKADSEKEKRLRMEELKLAPKTMVKKRPATRLINKPKFGFEFSKSGFGDGIAVATIDPGASVINLEDFGFELKDVDRAPRAIRKIPPVYPYKAKSRGIRAKVKIRCLVDKNGMPQKIIAAECDPPDVFDIFGPPAVEAVKKWRFSPGEIGGDPVPTMVAFPIIFELDS